jgi:uncharacterized repeat protein (TIGR03803 family)
MKGKKPLIGSMAVCAIAFGFLVITSPAYAASTEKVLYSFCAASNCGDGEQSWASLIFDSAGNLYGTTAAGGSSQYLCGGIGCGTIFELSPGVDGKWTEKVVYKFCSAAACADGANPYAGLIFDSAGNLYGTTAAGGSSPYLCGGIGCGTIFELSPGADGKWTEKVLYKFCSAAACADGANPYAGLIFDSAGNLFGTTYNGGTSCLGCGTVFELTHRDDGKWTEKVLHRFRLDSKRHDGVSPGYGSLIFDKAGNLYGTTYYGGRCVEAPGCGTVFQLTRHAKDQWTEKVLYRFQANGTDGHNPYYGLVFDAAGNSYGSTFEGGRSSSTSKCGEGCGTVFQLTPGTKGRWAEKVLYSFDGMDGTGAIDNLILDSKGNVYGNTSIGGTYGRGTVFRLSPVAGGKWKEQLYSFKSGKDGNYPSGGLIFDSAGNLYGTTFAGGDHDGGTVYKFIP